MSPKLLNLVSLTAQVEESLCSVGIGTTGSLLVDSARTLHKSLPWETVPVAVEKKAPVLPPDPPAEIGGCKALLLEIIRRAAYDWVLYRTHRVMNKRKLADDAFSWLFNEKKGHPAWTERLKNGKEITGFISICEALDLDPDMVRAHVKRLTVENVMSIGRPAEYRRQEWRDDSESYSAPPIGGSDSLYDDLAPFDGLSDE